MNSHSITPLKSLAILATTFGRNVLVTCVVVSAGIGLAAIPKVTIAESVYVYETDSGSRLITDHLRSEPGYRLLKVYRIKSYRTEPSATPGPLRPTKSHYDSLIAERAASYGVDSALVKAMVQVESAFNPRAISHKGAEGLMQLMPDTARRYGVDNRADPHQNLTGGVHYLKDLLAMFSQDIRLAVAAYNAGENAVLHYSDVPPFNETQNYVRQVLALHELYTNPPGI